MSTDTQTIAVSWRGQDGRASLDPTQHVPVVTMLAADAGWGVYCFACSRAVLDYVPACLVFSRDEWPPTRLVAAPRSHPDAV